MEKIKSGDVRDSLQTGVSGLPEAPCYVIICLDSAYAGQEYALLETGFVAGNMLIQATAIDLGCHFKTELTPAERSNIQIATAIPSSHIPQAIVSIGPIEVPNTFDFSGDGKVNFEDFSILTKYWLQDEPLFDIAPRPYGDGTVNYKDVDVFTDAWLTGTRIPPLPGPASNPSPANNAKGVDTTADLSWAAGSDATSYDVYFGTSSPPAFQGNQTDTTFDPGTMETATTYNWRINAVNDWGQTEGEVWNFKTKSPGPG